VEFGTLFHTERSRALDIRRGTRFVLFLLNRVKNAGPENCDFCFEKKDISQIVLPRAVSIVSSYISTNNIGFFAFSIQSTYHWAALFEGKATNRWVDPGWTVKFTIHELNTPMTVVHRLTRANGFGSRLMVHITTQNATLFYFQPLEQIMYCTILQSTLLKAHLKNSQRPLLALASYILWNPPALFTPSAITIIVTTSVNRPCTVSVQTTAFKPPWWK
jgi:hypothetical protein